jgi:hypothetical protein
MPKVKIVIELSCSTEASWALTGTSGRLLVAPSSSCSSAASSSSSSSSSDDSSCLPSWTCLADGHWLQVNDHFDDCDGLDEESKSTTNWFHRLSSRRRLKRYVPSWSTIVVNQFYKTSCQEKTRRASPMSQYDMLFRPNRSLFF